MNTDLVSGTSVNTSTSQAGSQTQDDATAISGDFETFLVLLTAQMRNQDPLKPTDSTEFVSQLANFSAVEQQVKTNDALEAIYDALNTEASLSNLASWIGREAQHSGGITFVGSPIDVSASPKVTADTATLEVVDATGEVVKRQAFDPAAASVVWDGTRDDLAFAPRGKYSFRLTYVADGELVDSQSGKVFADITEVKIENGTPILIDAEGLQIPLADVSGVRAPIAA